MSLAHSPSLVLPGLVLCLDAANRKSYPGTGTTWTDLSGLGNNGTLVNGVGYNSGNLGSLSFDGVNDRVDFANNSTTGLFGKSQATISCWFRGNGGTGTQRNLFSLGIDNTFKNKFGITLLSTNLLNVGCRSISTENIQFKSTTSTLTSNDWTFVCGTVNLVTNDIKVYINGNEVQTTGTISFSQTTFSDELPSRNCIGCGIALEYFFLGNISNALLYERTLTASEIQQNFNATRSRYGI